MPVQSGLDQIFQQQKDKFDLFIADNKKLLDDLPLKEIAEALANNLDDESEARQILLEYFVEKWNNNQADKLLEFEDLADDVVKDMADYG